MVEVNVFENIMKRNEDYAKQNAQLLKKTLCINIMSSPGAGKTTLLEKTLEKLKEKYSIAVIEGDVATSNDTKRLKKIIKNVYQIKTENFGGSCHLDARMVNLALKKLNADKKIYDIIIIENVGNLICPADFNLGEDKKVVLLSITEGEDKPLKYPLMFQVADIILINKIDLIPYLDINYDIIKNNVKRVKSNLKILSISAKSGLNMEEWIKILEKWIKGKINGRS